MANKLTLGQGGMPRGWGMPNPIYNYKTHKYDVGPIVWHGRKPATTADVAALRKRFGDVVKVDRPSMRGKDDPKWSTWDQRMKKRKSGEYTQHLVVK